MQRQMTITVDEMVYETLKSMAEQRSIGELLTEIVQSRQHGRTYTDAELEKGYRAMAADEEYEQNAKEWISGLIEAPQDDQR